MGKTFIEILKSDIAKFNPYHDRLGRFTTGSGFGMSSANYTGDKSRQAVTFSANPETKAGANAIARHGGVVPTAYGWNNGKPGGETKKPEGEKPKDKPEQPKEQRPRKGLESGLGKDHAQAVEDIAQKSPENIKKMWDKYGDEITVDRATGSYRGSCDYRGAITVNIANDSKGSSMRNPYETTMHESGHSIDRAISRKVGYRFSERYNDGAFSKSIKSEVEKHVQRKAKELENDAEYKANHPYAYKKNGTVKIDYARSAIGSELRKGTFKDTGDVSDIFEGATRGKISGTGGHGKSYWNFHDVSVEAFAEMFSATTTNPASLGNIKKYFPESYKIFNEMVDYAGTL